MFGADQKQSANQTVAGRRRGADGCIHRGAAESAACRNRRCDLGWSKGRCSSNRRARMRAWELGRNPSLADWPGLVRQVANIQDAMAAWSWSVTLPAGNSTLGSSNCPSFRHCRVAEIEFRAVTRNEVADCDLCRQMECRERGRSSDARAVPSEGRIELSAAIDRCGDRGVPLDRLPGLRPGRSARRRAGKHLRAGGERQSGSGAWRGSGKNAYGGRHRVFAVCPAIGPGGRPAARSRTQNAEGRTQKGGTAVARVRQCERANGLR